MVKVALITTWKQRCGIASYSENLAEALAKEGVDVYVVRLPRFGMKSPSIFQNIVDSIPVDKVDIIHCQHEYGLFGQLEKYFYPALAKLGRPLVTTMHSVGSFEADNAIAEASTKVIVHNDFCFKRFGRDEKKTVIIPHGMTPLQTPPPPKEICKKRLGIQPNVPIVGYLGFISNYKGLEGLIEAMVKVPNAALLIGGGWFVEQDTDYIVSLREMANTLIPHRVQWIGFVPDNELSLAYGAMDMVVYPSRFMTESGALLMAVSHRKAVIASDLPPVREKARKGALMVFKDTDDLSKKINLMFADEKMREHYETCATEFTQENSWTNIAKRHVELYQELASAQTATCVKPASPNPAPLRLKLKRLEKT